MKNRLAIAILSGAVIGVVAEYVIRPYVTEPIEVKAKEVLK